VWFTRFLIACHPDEDTGDRGMEATIRLNEVTETADLLHTLASDTGEETPARQTKPHGATVQTGQSHDQPLGLGTVGV